MRGKSTNLNKKGVSHTEAPAGGPLVLMRGFPGPGDLGFRFQHAAAASKQPPKQSCNHVNAPLAPLSPSDPRQGQRPSPDWRGYLSRAWLRTWKRVSRAHPHHQRAASIGGRGLAPAGEHQGLSAGCEVRGHRLQRSKLNFSTEPSRRVLMLLAPWRRWRAGGC